MSDLQALRMWEERLYQEKPLHIREMPDPDDALECPPAMLDKLRNHKRLTDDDKAEAAAIQAARDAVGVAKDEDTAEAVQRRVEGLPPADDNRRHQTEAEAEVARLEHLHEFTAKAAQQVEGEIRIMLDEIGPQWNRALTKALQKEAAHQNSLLEQMAVSDHRIQTLRLCQLFIDRKQGSVSLPPGSTPHRSTYDALRAWASPE